MKIELAPEREKIVRRLMKSGDYETESAAVADALHIIAEEYDLELMMPKAVVKAEIQKAVEQSQQGEGESWNLEAFLADARAKLAESRRAKKVHA